MPRLPSGILGGAACCDITMRLRLLLLMFSVVPMVGCDHATKYWAESQLQGAEPIQVLPNVLSLTYVRNFDVAFHALRHVPEAWKFWLIVGAGLLAITFVTFVLLSRRLPLLEASAYALVLSGAIGNVSDRLLRGYVVDFIHLEYWPVFNVADAWVVAGVVLLLVSAFIYRGPAQPAVSRASG